MSGFYRNTAYSITLLARSLVHPPEGTQPEPRKRNREAHREHQPRRSRRVASLILPVFAHASHGPDHSQRQKRKARYFQPELVDYPAKRMSRRAHSGQKRSAHPTAPHSLGGGREDKLDLPHSLAVNAQPIGPRFDHQSILAVGGRTITRGEFTLTCDAPVSGVRFQGDSWISN
jgi:hypothetical protein